MGAHIIRVRIAQPRRPGANGVPENHPAIHAGTIMGRPHVFIFRTRLARITLLGSVGCGWNMPNRSQDYRACLSGHTGARRT